MSITFRVHWLSATIWGSSEYGLKMWQEWFEKYLGTMQVVGHGGRGFKVVYKTLLEARLYAQPIAQDGIDSQYFCFEVPGQACDAIPDKVIQEFIVTLNRWEKARITRVDLAWDGVPFTPEQVREAISLNHIRTYTRRKKMSITTAPFDIREDGQIGTSSLQFGSRISSRMLRVYDQHGPVRIEMQARAERADLIARDVLVHLPKGWIDKAIGHLRDFVDFLDPVTESLLPWWKAFINNQDRAMKTISDARILTLSGMFGWMKKAGAATLSVIEDKLGIEAIHALLIEGRRKRGKRYDAILKGDSNSMQEGLQ